MMKTLINIVTGIVMATGLSVSAWSASIYRTEDTKFLAESLMGFAGGILHPALVLDGEISYDDSSVLAKLVEKIDQIDEQNAILKRAIVLFLNSPGGNFSGGLKLSALIRERGIVTVVRREAKCLSACAVAFLGGQDIVWNSDVPASPLRVLEPGGVLGFHRPKLEVSFPSHEKFDGGYVSERTQQAYAVAAKQIGEFIRELNLNNIRSSLAAEMLKTTKVFFT